MNQIGEAIRQAREQKRWTQQQMADKMGISMRQYNKYEAGKLPKYKSTVIEQIDQLLGTKIQELIYEQNVPRTTSGTDRLTTGDEGHRKEHSPNPLPDMMPKATVEIPASLLQTLVESNRAMAEAAREREQAEKIRAEAYKQIADSHALLVAMVKVTEKEESKPTLDFATILPGIQNLLLELGIPKLWKNKVEGLNILNKQLFGNPKEAAPGRIHDGEGKKHK